MVGPQHVSAFGSRGRGNLFPVRRSVLICEAFDLDFGLPTRVLSILSPDKILEDKKALEKLSSNAALRNSMSMDHTCGKYLQKEILTIQM